MVEPPPGLRFPPYAGGVDLHDEPMPALRPVPVDLEELADALEGDPMMCGGILDVDTGTVWPQFMLDSMVFDEREALYDGIENVLRIDNLGSHAAFQDMCDFVGTLSGEHLTERLANALRGRGAFRRFKDILGERPKLLETYFAFADARKIERAAAWLAEEGYVGRFPPRMAAVTETPVPRHTGVDG